MVLYIFLMISTLSPLHAHCHVYLILFHFVHILALLLNFFILAFPIPFLSGMHYPLILPVTMWYSLKNLMYYVLTLYCNSKALCSNHCIYLFSFYLIFFSCLFILDVLTLASAICTILPMKMAPSKKIKK